MKFVVMGVFIIVNLAETLHATEERDLSPIVETLHATSLQRNCQKKPKVSSPPVGGRPGDGKK